MKQNSKKYQNFSVKVCSYQLVASKMWRPKAFLREDKKSAIVETPLLWNRDFPTKKEADKFAVLQTEMFLNRKLS